MDLSYTAEQEAFRKELRDWLEVNWEPFKHHFRDEERNAAALEGRAFDKALAWHKKLYEGGWVGIWWPQEYGGRGAGLVEQAIYNEEMGRTGVPTGVNLLGISLLGPTLMHWGNERQKQRFLPKILPADEIWCQGYSEPGAGSDLANLQTRAVDDGDFFVVNGQKVWTSGAHVAHWIFLLVRTDPQAPKHRGITYLLVDMRSPGITVRPLVQMTGNAGFNEVFFEDVRVPKENVVSEVNNGWAVAITTLMFERTTLGGFYRYEHTIDRLVRLAKKVPRGSGSAWDDAGVRQQIAQFAIEVRAMKLNEYRRLTRQLKGQPPGAEGSIGKLAASELNLRMANFGIELLGPFAALDKDSDVAIDHGRWLSMVLGARAATIAGGTSEVQRGIIGERVLGLPKSR
jgi:alkylation response protein AidB-like acyl-CoA dehydrogenase